MLETETVLDRRRLRRSVSFWRALGMGGLALAGGALALGGEKLTSISGKKQIARIAIEGTITEDRDQLKMLKDIAENKNVSALLVYVNSPGGTTTGGEALYEGLRGVAKVKPVVAQFGTVAASAAYIAGLGTDHIVARGNSITGSIGVLVEWPEVVQLLDKVGVKMNTVKSGVLKASPSPFETLTDDSRKVAAGMVNDGFKWFLSLVETRRGVKPSDIAGLVEGKIFSGREALEVKLVDQIGGEDEAVAWLKDVKNVDKDAKVVDWKPESTGVSLLGFKAMAANALTGLLGPEASQLASTLFSAQGKSTLGLDGLLSVWHPSEK
jgi:protease IV